MLFSMSSVHENDENLGVHPAGKQSNSEAICDIFALEQPTGRPSILRQSQFENLSNKTVPKGAKVFQFFVIRWSLTNDLNYL